MMINSTINKNLNFVRQALDQREKSKDEKLNSFTHYIEQLKRSMIDNPMINRALTRFYHIIIKRFDRTIKLFFSVFRICFLFKEFSSNQLFEENHQSTDLSRQISGLMTRTTFNAISKTPRQRTINDIESLEHLLNRCEFIRQLPTNIRQYIARSLLFLNYPSNTILTQQNSPPFLVYIVVSGEIRKKQTNYSLESFLFRCSKVNVNFSSVKN